jgi:predicted sugar kinase
MDKTPLATEIEFKQMLLMEIAPGVVEKAFEEACKRNNLDREWNSTQQFIENTASFINKIVENIKVPL